jgi:hypothetical protein
MPRDLGRKLCQTHVHFFDQRPHWRDDLLLVGRAMRLEPRLFVVAREAAKEDERGGGEGHG